MLSLADCCVSDGTHILGSGCIVSRVAPSNYLFFLTTFSPFVNSPHLGCIYLRLRPLLSVTTIVNHVSDGVSPTDSDVGNPTLMAPQSWGHWSRCIRPSTLFKTGGLINFFFRKKIKMTRSLCQGH